jgi:hypothetical protein
VRTPDFEPSLAIRHVFAHDGRDGRVAEWFKAPVLKFARACIGPCFPIRFGSLIQPLEPHRLPPPYCPVLCRYLQFGPKLGPQNSRDGLLMGWNPSSFQSFKALILAGRKSCGKF